VDVATARTRPAAAQPDACHPLRVTIRILSQSRVTDPGVACAALLRDAVEDQADDTALGRREAALAALARQFGERAADLVAAVTNPVYESGRDQRERYREQVTASLQANPWARVIGLGLHRQRGWPFLHHRGRSCPGSLPSTVPLMPPLRELSLRPDTPLDPGAKDMIARQPGSAEDRLVAICR
jgi:hypothetical protein